MEVKAGYKQTEVGILPKDWEVKPLDNISFVTSGKRLPLGKSLTDDETPHPYIRVVDMRMETVSLSDLKYVPVVVFPYIKRYRIFKDDIFIAVVGNTLGIVGKIPVELDGANLTENADRITNITCSRDYLLHILKSPLIQNTIEAIKTVGAQPKLALTRLRKFNIPLPPTITEQEAIAEALGDADAFIEAVEQLLAKKRQIKQGAMSELLTGKMRLPEFDKKQGYKQTEVGIFPEDWDIVPLKNISSMHGRIGWQGLKQSEFTMNLDQPFLITGMNFKDGEIRWDEVYHISNERYEIAKEIQLQIGDVLMTKDGTIGKILYVDHIPHSGKASLNSHLLVFRPLNKKYVPKFLFYQLNSRTFHNHIELEKSGTTFFGITQEAVGKYNAFLPSFAEQTAIAEILSDMDAEITALEEKLVKARQVKAGMMSVLLTGRVRLV